MDPGNWIETTRLSFYLQQLFSTVLLIVFLLLIASFSLEGSSQGLSHNLYIFAMLFIRFASLQNFRLCRCRSSHGIVLTHMLAKSPLHISSNPSDTSTIENPPSCPVKIRICRWNTNFTGKADDFVPPDV
jgi:hypothetical protein